MIHRPRLCLICCMCLALLVPPSPSTAGAWPREAGKTFVALGFGKLSPVAGADQTETTLYMERGLGRDLTLGFSGSANVERSGEGHVFLRLPPLRFDRAGLIAVELGYGRKTVDSETFTPFGKLGVSWSKGIALWERSGWLSLDAAYLKDGAAADDRLKLDATLGLSMTERFSVIGQVFAEDTQFGDSLTLAPSVLYRIQSGRVSFQLGYEQKMGLDAQTALRLSVWTEF